MRITKQEFIKRVEMLTEHNQDCITLMQALRKFLLSGYSVVTFADKLFQTYIYDLALWAKMDGDVLFDFIVDGVIEIGKKGEDMQKITTAEKLWEFYELHG